MAIRSLSATTAPVNTIRSTDSKHSPNQKGNIEIRHDNSGPISARSRLASIVAMGFIALLIGSSTGCSLTSGCRVLKKECCFDDMMMKHRNKALATKSWHRDKRCFAKHCNIRDIKAGYMAGFSDVGQGSNGCVPTVAPSNYLGWQYQSAEGQSRINAWFRGYPLGARAAEQQGVGSWGNVRPQGANIPQQQQAVFVPSRRRSAAQAEEQNPFYDNQYPYEPAPYEPIEDGSLDGEGESPSDDPIGDALDQGLGDEPMGTEINPLQDAMEDAEEAADAIRDALDAGIGDDSAFNDFESSSDAIASIGDAEFAPQPSDEITYTIQDAAKELVEDVFDGEAIERVEPAEAFVSELPFSFE